jgi:predicted amidohydrolase YtcJ
MEALYTYTKWGAYRNDDEDLLGTIEPGMLADLVVLGGDFLEVSEDRLCEDLPVMMTVVGGRIVFQTDERKPICGR